MSGNRVFVSCVSDEFEKPGEDGGLSFKAMTDFLPRAGEFIRTQDNILCEVRMVLHSVNEFPKDGQALGYGLVPTVVAIQVDEGNE